MITIEPTSNLELIEDIQTDPILWSAINGTHNVPNDYKVNESFQYLLLKEDGQVKGCFSYRMLNAILVETHIAILPKYWGSKCGLEATKKAFEWLKANTLYKKAFTFVPVVCENVVKLCTNLGGSPCGIVSNGGVYAGKYVDVILFEYLI